MERDTHSRTCLPDGRQALNPLDEKSLSCRTARSDVVCEGFAAVSEKEKEKACGLVGT